MKFLFSLLFIFFLVLLTWSQSTRGQYRFSAGIKRSIKYDLDLGLESNLRLNQYGQLHVLYQEASIKYSKFKWFKPSIDYRIITAYDERRNFSISNRLNFNLSFYYKLKDFKFSERFRYQQYLGQDIETDGDLDPSFRMKTAVEWSKKKALASPELSVEFFYNPLYGPRGQRFNRVRLGAACTFDLPKSNEISLVYYFGHKFNNKIPYNEHIISIEYSYEWKKKKKKVEPKETNEIEP